MEGVKVGGIKKKQKTAVRPYIRLVREKIVEHYPKESVFHLAIRNIRGDLVYDNDKDGC